MDVTLVRHGEDQAKAEERYGDTGLTDVGRKQAESLARALADVPFDRCFCSNMLRSRETADILTGDRTLTPTVDADFAEGSTGDLEGLSFADGRERFPETFRLGRSIGARLAATGRTAPGGETVSEFRARALRALQRIERERGRSESVLVVSHGGLLNYLLQLLFEVDAPDHVPFGFDHCGVVRLIDYGEEPAYGPFPMLRFATLK